MRTLTKLSEDELAEAWDGAKAGEDHFRGKLIVHYQTLVRHVANKVSMTLPAHIDKEDLVQYGTFGLMEAIDRYDRERGVKFETYAIVRIKGAIIDELRSIDWIPRSVRSQVKGIERAVSHLETQFQRPPTPDEVASYMEISVADLAKRTGEQNFLNIVSLNSLMEPQGEKGDSFSPADRLQDNRTQNPVFSYEANEVKALLATAISTLGTRESIVLTLYYFEGLTLAEIGKVMGVTESRVCQMHTRAMTQVRGRLST